MRRCDELAVCTEEPGRITRPFASGAMRSAHHLVETWMREAGMAVQRDNIGNLRGRYDGGAGATLLLGSHLDSVRDAGRYDGPLGVVVAIAAVQRLHEQGRRLPFAIEVIAFADEEGLRFGSTYLGSRAFAGRLDARELERVDAGGVTMADAVRAFGGDPDRIGADRWSGGPLSGYIEVHIEQGPVLEAHSLAVGVVSAIAGQDRFDIVFAGEAGHAGTVPMVARRDALVAAAAFVQAVDEDARRHDGLVATVGRLAVEPGAANVIPGTATLTLDVRHAADADRLAARDRLLTAAHEIARRRGVRVDVTPRSERSAVTCSPRLKRLLAAAIGGEPLEIVSGAGHDGVYVSELTEIAMLFVRCKGGVSHHPAESVDEEDVGVAIDVVVRLLELLASP